MFAGIHGAATGGPPYHRLEPDGLSVQRLGTDAAIVTFHLLSEVRTARRTLVLQRRAGRWLIVHLHGSTIHHQHEPQ